MLKFILTITVPPKLSEFVFASDLTRGDRVSVQCSVIRGDSPLTITWTKDDQKAESIPGINIRKLDIYTVRLSIGQLSAHHTGDYKCIAQNDAAQVIQQARLNVHGNF